MLARKRSMRPSKGIFLLLAGALSMTGNWRGARGAEANWPWPRNAAAPIIKARIPAMTRRYSSLSAVACSRERHLDGGQRHRLAKIGGVWPSAPQSGSKIVLGRGRAGALAGGPSGGASRGTVKKRRSMRVMAASAWVRAGNERRRRALSGVNDHSSKDNMPEMASALARYREMLPMAGGVCAFYMLYSRR